MRQGYGEGNLRKSLCHPLTRKNTGDNTPAVIHTEIVPGDRIKLTVVSKGGGSENMQPLYMLKPAEGLAGIKERVVATVEEAGPNPCPPIIVGVGIGGTFERAALLAKKVSAAGTGSGQSRPGNGRPGTATVGGGQPVGHRTPGAGRPDHRLGRACLDAAQPYRLAAGGRQYSMSRFPPSGSGALMRFAAVSFRLKEDEHINKSRTWIAEGAWETYIKGESWPRRCN